MLIALLVTAACNTNETNKKQPESTDFQQKKAPMLSKALKTHSGYFLKNQVLPDSVHAILKITSYEDFDKYFSAATTQGSHFEIDSGFFSDNVIYGIVETASDTLKKINLLSLEDKGHTLVVTYEVIESDTQTFVSREIAIVSIPKSEINEREVIFEKK